MVAPSGTVTLLFTDIEGSTRLWEEFPEKMAVALRRHDELLRSAIESSGGYVFKTVGDAFCAAFSSAKDAVEAVITSQRSLQSEHWPESVAIRVRMALHTGKCEERDGDYFGQTVNRTARLEATAHGGQVVVSGATAELVGHLLPAGVFLVDRGTHLLKDMERPEAVFELAIEGLASDFPPLRSRQAESPTNLIESGSTFVGREVEVAAVLTTLDSSRLVTLTGPGGAGKTRLAVEVGRRTLGDISDGVWMSELATVTNSDLVAAEVCSDLRIADRPGQSSLDTLVEVLAGQERLVILDNCEQVIDGCAALADVLVRRCPGVRILATSREPLRIGAEALYRVPPLSLPPEQVDGRLDLAGSGAAALFLERATAQTSGFEVGDEDAPIVAAICRRLDGMPLAIELATARLRSMSLVTLHDRLEHRFGLLTGGSRVALPRQQTLRALVDWSYDLLSGPEQALFQRLSVFVDGFTLEAAEGVCPLDDIPGQHIADLLASLVDKSLVVAERRGREFRFTLLESLRNYGADRLAEADAGTGIANTADRVAAAHMEYYLAFGTLAGVHLDGPEAFAWQDRLDQDDLNLRQAIACSLTTPNGADRALDLFWSLQVYWLDSRRPAQALALLDATLDRLGTDLPNDRTAQALLCRSMLLSGIDKRLQLQACTHALDNARASGDSALEAFSLALASNLLAFKGEMTRALELGAEAIELAEQIGDPLLKVKVLGLWSGALAEAGMSDSARAALDETLDLAERLGRVVSQHVIHNIYAVFLIDRGELDAARSHLEASLDNRGTKLNASMAATLFNLAWVQLRQGEVTTAAARLREVLRFERLQGLVASVPYDVLGLACCATQFGRTELAARLHGGADALLQARSNQWERLEATIQEEDLGRLRAVLEDEFDKLYSEGRGMGGDEIIKLALTVE